jgi:hypothetical protein
MIGARVTPHAEHQEILSAVIGKVTTPPVTKRRFVAQFVLGPTDDSPASLQWQEVNGLRDPEHSLCLIFAPLDYHPTRATVLRYVVQALLAGEASWFRVERNQWFVNHDALRARFKLGPEFCWLAGEGVVKPDYDLGYVKHGVTSHVAQPWGVVPPAAES